MGITMFEFASDLRMLASVWGKVCKTALCLHQTGGQRVTE